VKARLMSKPPRQAEWQPATLAEVSQETVDAFFTMPEGEGRLPLMTNKDYNHYPHERFALPSEREIEKFVRERGKSDQQVIEKFARRWNEKERVREKVAEVLSRRARETPEGYRWL
jgi:3-hydroxyisobutyryl-CoA hydrolase